MKKSSFILLILFLCYHFLNSQNRRNQSFYLTPNFVISIDNDTFKVDTLEKKLFLNDFFVGGSYEGYSCIADTSGNLMYFTSVLQHRLNDIPFFNPVYLFKVNKINNRYTPEIFSNSLNSSTTETQGTIILPIDEKYFVFTVKYFDSGERGVGCYLIKDDTVIEKIYSFNRKEFEEKLTAIRHCNGRDWWVLTKILNEDSLKILLLSTDGILSVFNTSIPDRLPKSSGVYDWGYIGKLVASPNGKKISIIILSLISKRTFTRASF